MGLFTKDSKLEFELIPSTPEQKTARNWLQDLYQQDFNTPLQGVAGLTDAEKAIQGDVAQLQGRYKDDYGAAANYYKDILAGGYDPRTSPAYEGFRQEAGRLKDEGQLDVARAAQKAGMARSTPSAGAQGKVGAQYDSMILQALGGLYENERNRQTVAAGALPALSNQQVNTMQGMQSLAQVERGVEQARQDALYNQALQTLLAPYTYQANIASTLLNEQRYMGVQTGGGMTDLGFIANAGISAAGSYFGAKALTGLAAGGGGWAGMNSSAGFGSTPTAGGTYFA